jgi:TPR repeat protein
MACNLAGAITNDGLGMKKDAARALAFFEQSCAADHPDGCSNLSTSSPDKAKAAEAKAKACKLGDKESC